MASANVFVVISNRRLVQSTSEVCWGACTAGVRLAVFDGAKKLLTTAEQAYKEELEKANYSSFYRLK